MAKLPNNPNTSELLAAGNLLDWWRGVEITRFIRSTKLFYAGVIANFVPNFVAMATRKGPG